MKYKKPVRDKEKIRKKIQSEAPEIIETLEKDNLSGSYKQQQTLTKGILVLAESLIEAMNEITDAINDTNQELVEIGDKLEKLVSATEGMETVTPKK